MLSFDKKNKSDFEHHSSKKKALRCDCCNNFASKTHPVSEAGGLLDVCEKCNYILSLQDEIVELKM